MVKYLRYIMLFSIVFYLNNQEGNAQKVLQVVEKKFEKQVKVSEGETVRIIAQKAKIEVKGWDKKEVRIILKFKSSNTDKALAEKELDYVKYGLLKENNALEIQNTFMVPGNVARINSVMSVEYQVWMPRGNPLYIINKYGDVSLTNIGGAIDVSLDLGNLILDNINSTGKVIINYGDIVGTVLAGNWSFISNKSKIDIFEAAGSYYFHSNYGEVNLSSKVKLKKVEIEGDRTEASLNLSQLSQYNYDLITKHSNIVISNEEYKKQIRNSGRGNMLFKINSNKSNPLIKVNTSYNPIIIKENN